MNFQQACDWLIDHGAKEYPNKLKPPHARMFTWHRLVGVPKCALNDRPPSLHVTVYAPHRVTPDASTTGTVEFEVFGKAHSGEWLAAKVYAVDIDEMVGVLPKVVIAAGAMWKAFLGAMAGQEAE